jgi:hypothetical protein
MGEVRYVPSGTAVAEREMKEKEVFPFERLHRSSDLCPPIGDELISEFPHGEELSSAWWDTYGVRHPAYSFSGPPEATLQIGGYPRIENIDPLEVDAEAAVSEAAQDDSLLLLQWNATVVKALDLGVMYWVIRREDLAALRFDRVEVTVDMIG